jgi:hypothetical protein
MINESGLSPPFKSVVACTPRNLPLCFGAWPNVESSDPCWLCLDLSRAVYQKDAGSRFIRDLRAQMLRSIGTSALSASDAHNLKAQATTAALDEFRLEVWRLDRALGHFW